MTNTYHWVVYLQSKNGGKTLYTSVNAENQYTALKLAESMYGKENYVRIQGKK
jgi:hypothetical protein